RKRYAEGRNLSVYLLAKRAHVVFARARAIELRRDPVEGCIAPLVRRVRQSPAEQPAEVLGSRVRLLEERLEQQLEQQIVAAHVDDEGHRRTNRRDVREVLIWPDADIRAATDAQL